MTEPSDPAGGRPFWFRPKWVVGHVLMVVLVIGAVVAGFWQLDRHDQRREDNAEIASRTARPPVPVGELVGPDDASTVGRRVRNRRATATGTYDTDGEVLIRSRALDERPGFWIATPLVLDDGTALIVNRGFVPYTDDLDEAFRAAEPPPGSVEVEGLVLATQERGGIGPTDPEGTQEALVRLDVERIQQQYDRDLYPVYLQLTAQDPAPEGLPTMLGEPELDSGPHLSYAGQWFLFALVGIIGWPVLLNRTGREGTSAPPAPPRRPSPVSAGRR